MARAARRWPTGSGGRRQRHRRARCTRRSRRSASTARDGVGTASVDHVRVQPRDGQLQRLARRLLGRPSRRHPGLQGGFIWEWKDHGLRQALPDGSVRLAYGGEFGDTPHDGNFVADGLVSADLEPHPANARGGVGLPPGYRSRLATVPFASRTASRFAQLDWLAAHWELLVDGDVARHGTICDTRPSPPTQDPRWRCRAPFRLAIAMSYSPFAGRPSVTSGGPRPATSWRGTRSRCANPAADRGHPRPSSPDAALTAPPALNLWRAATDNDGFKLMPELAERLRVGGQALRTWQQAGIDQLPADELVDHHVELTDDADGRTYRHTIDVPSSLADLPRVGVMFTVEGRFTRRAVVRPWPARELP